jgi:hypothetical protein
VIALLLSLPVADPMTPCTVTLSPGDDVQAHLVEGAVVCLRPGVYPVSGGLFIEHSLTLRGEAGVVLDAQGRGSVVHVAADGLSVHLSGLVLSHGHAELGAGLRLSGASEVRAEDLAVRANDPVGPQHAGIGAQRGVLHLVGARLEGADGVWLTGVVDATLTDCILSGPLTLREGAVVRVEGGQLDGPVRLRGSTTRAPSLTLVGVRAPQIENDPALPGTITRAKRRRG